MPPSSSSSADGAAGQPPPGPAGLFDGVLARGAGAAETGDDAWLRAMLDVEAALARAEASAGVIPDRAAGAIAAACDARRFDAARLGADAAASGNPVVPLVAALRAEVGGDAADWVHHGATSQDVLDSAAMLVSRRALGPLLADLDAAAAACDALADAHRATLLPARTLLQQALPTTFGLKAAGWLAGLDDAAARLRHVRAQRLAVQLGGAGGTAAALDDRGVAVLQALADELGLACPPLPWHTVRTRVAELAGALGEAAGVVGKVAGDLARLAQTEVGEVAERAGDAGGSSALPHKRNPIASVCAVASAERAPGLVASLLATGSHHEHERAAGAWHAEWRPLSELLAATGSAAAWLAEALQRLEVRPQAMRANLARTGGRLLSERVADALTPPLGRERAVELVRQASLAADDQGRALRDVLSRYDEVTAHLTGSDLDALLDPAGFLGSAEAFIDRARAARTRSAPDPRSPAGPDPSAQERP